MSDTVVLGITVALLLLNGFFVGAEFALISARRTLVEPQVAAGSRRARITLHAMENVSMMMAGAQLGITVCSLALLALSEPTIAHLLEQPFTAIGVPDVLLHPSSFVIALCVVTFLHVVLGEMVPKNIALAGPERSAMVLAPPLVLIVRALLPAIWTMNQIANLVLRMVRIQPKQEVTSTYTRDEVAELVGEARQGGLLDEHDERLLLGALTFEERPTSGIVLPMSTVRTLPEGATHADGEAVAATGFSRFPMTRNDGSLAGYVHLKDVIALDPEQRTRPIAAELIRELPTVSSSESLRGALRVMQISGAHLAEVRDPRGSTVGVVTLGDVIAELVGQIRDDSHQHLPQP